MFHSKKIVVGPSISISSQIKKITIACPSDPTANKGDTSPLTIVANDTSTRVSISTQTVRGLLKIPHLY
jgi:hypothetical protein